VLRRIAAALVLLVLASSAAGTYAARAGKACARCGHGACCAAGKAGGCSMKSSCCDPAPEDGVALDHGGKPALVPGAWSLLSPAVLGVDRPARLGSTRDLPRVPLVPPPRLSA